MGTIQSTYDFPLGGKAIIVGKVVDIKSGEALPGASIEILNTTYGCATDLDGGYQIFNLGRGTYTIKARYIGYKSTFLANVKLHNNQFAVINFELADSKTPLPTSNSRPNPSATRPAKPSGAPEARSPMSSTKPPKPSPAQSKASTP